MISPSANDDRTGTSNRSMLSVFISSRLSWAILASALVVTLVATFYMKSSVDRIAEKDFTDHCNDVQKRISKRLDDHARILLSGAAFFKASDSVTREEWKNFTQYQSVDKQLPGIQGIGFSLIIPRDNLPKHLLEIRSQGFPEYKVRPDGKRDLYTSIIYLEPFKDRNLRAFGYDMFSEPIRRKAMEQARDTNTPALSGKVILVQETDKDVQAGTLMYVPVYRKGMPIDTVEQRWAAIVGWVYSPYRMNDLMQGVLGAINHDNGKTIHLQIFDGEQPISESLLYFCHPDSKKSSFATTRFTRLVPVYFNGQRWTLRFTQTGGGLATVDYLRVWITLFSGLTISLLLFLLIRTLQHSRAEALQLVEERTTELQQERRKLLDAQHVAQLGSWYLAIPENTLSWSDETYRIFGLPIGTPLTLEGFINAIHPDDRELVASAWTAALSGAPYDIVHRICVGEQVKWVHERAEIVFDEQGQPLSGTGTVHDITERKKAELELLESRLSLQSILDGTHAGTWKWNIQTRETLFNERWAEIIGYTLTELEPVSIETWMKFTHPDDLEKSNELLEKHFRGELEYYECECRMKHKNGHWVWVLDRGKVASWGDDGKPLWMFGTHQNITERKKAEEELRNSREQYQLVIAGSNDGIWDWNLKTNHLYLSPRWKEQLGYQDHELPDSFDSFKNNLHPDDAARVLAFAEEYLSGTEGRYAQEFRMRHRDGSWRWILAQGTEVRDTDSKLIRMVGSHSDITSRKTAEEALKAAKDAADTANQAKSDFLANMSHEIRTPMNGVIGMAQVLELTELTEEQQEYVNGIMVSGTNLLQLINDILDLSKIESGKIELEYENFSLNKAIKDVILTQQSRIFEKGLTLQKELQQLPAVVQGDQLRIKQILLNLLGNAIKFTERGSITIAATVREQHDERVVVRLTVSDTGIGMAPEALQKIFKPFEQADTSTTRRFGGTGLGLTICRKLVELMGGAISVESAPGVGSSFHLEIPFELGAAAVSRQVQATDLSEKPARPLTILIAEDNQMNQRILELLLQKIGHSAICTNNGKEALERWQKGGVDLILMDIQMPVMNGLEALEQIRKEEPVIGKHTAVIALTADALKGTEEKLLKAGFDGYLTKPVKIMDLVNELVRLTAGN